MNIFSNFNKAEYFEYSLSDFKDKPISIFYDWPCNWNADEIHKALSKNSINIILLAEPNEYFRIHDFVINNSEKYTAILTWSDEVISKCENAVLYPLKNDTSNFFFFS